MGNEETLLHFRRISISDWRLMLIRLGVGSGMSGILQMWMGCEICRPQTYFPYVGGSQSEADRRRSESPTYRRPSMKKELKKKKPQESAL